MYVKSLQGIPSRQIITLHVIRTEAAFTCLYKSTRTTRSVTNKEPGGSRPNQKGPGNTGTWGGEKKSGGTRRDQEGPGKTGTWGGGEGEIRGDQEEPGTAGDQEKSGGTRRRQEKTPGGTMMDLEETETGGNGRKQENP